MNKNAYILVYFAISLTLTFLSHLNMLDRQQKAEQEIMEAAKKAAVEVVREVLDSEQKKNKK